MSQQRRDILNVIVDEQREPEEIDTLRFATVASIRWRASNGLE